MKQRLCLLWASLFLFLGMALAQTKISGKVVFQEDGEPVVGASIFVQDGKTGVVTDVEGNFSITVPSGKKIVISYVGMESQTLVPRQGMKISLKSNSTLNEVVVTGMQHVDRRLFTGAATQIKASDAKLDGVADISRSECDGHVRHGAEDTCPRRNVYLRRFKTAVGSRRSHNGRRDRRECRRTVVGRRCHAYFVSHSWSERRRH